MADIWQAQNQFWNSFTWKAYDDQTIFTEGDLPAYPHITYESASGAFGTEATLSVHLWDRATSWAAIKQKADEIKSALSRGGVLVPHEDGYIWLKIPENTVFSRPFDTGSSDELVKRIMLTVSAEYLAE